jgi:hypothetical protein
MFHGEVLDTSRVIKGKHPHDRDIDNGVVRPTGVISEGYICLKRVTTTYDCSSSHKRFALSQNQESTEFAPIRIFWKDGHNDRAGGTDCVPWMVEPVTEATLECLLSDWDCVFAEYRPTNNRKKARDDEPESNEPHLLDDGEVDIKERHDKDAEAKGPYPVQHIPAWFDQPSGMQTVKFECNGRKRILYQRKFSRLHDIASKVSHLGTRVYYDDPDLNELLFGKFVS